ncbi:hypothetical protein PoB_003568100 [Plakobranchus ocellatus]|uniref:Ubiquitinyl hydrolase 1 n=1 Tax=Plakobranchus ocellatus TaxID=259542 RepID=A0AAV4ADF2_9GAST|nr:hypothetical protein PoB_003568100 [Plakobranchus ocellatus]
MHQRVTGHDNCLFRAVSLALYDDDGGGSSFDDTDGSHCVNECGENGSDGANDDADLVGDAVSGANEDDGRKPLCRDAFIKGEVLLDLLNIAKLPDSLEKLSIE